MIAGQVTKRYARAADCRAALGNYRFLTLCRAGGYAEATAAVSGSSWQARGNPAGYSA